MNKIEIDFEGQAEIAESFGGMSDADAKFEFYAELAKAGVIRCGEVKFIPDEAAEEGQ